MVSDLFVGIPGGMNKKQIIKFSMFRYFWSVHRQGWASGGWA